MVKVQKMRTSVWIGQDHSRTAVSPRTTWSACDVRWARKAAERLPRPRRPATGARTPRRRPAALPRRRHEPVVGAHTTNQMMSSRTSTRRASRRRFRSTGSLLTITSPRAAAPTITAASTASDLPAVPARHPGRASTSLVERLDAATRQQARHLILRTTPPASRRDSRRNGRNDPSLERTTMQGPDPSVAALSGDQRAAVVGQATGDR